VMRHNIAGSVYVLEEYVGFFNNYKVGISGNVDKRISALSSRSVGNLSLVYRKDFKFWEDAQDVELAAHSFLSDYRIPGKGREWYRTDLNNIIRTIETIIHPNNECYT